MLSTSPQSSNNLLLLSFAQCYILLHKLLHHTNLHSVYVCFPMRSCERESGLNQQSHEARALLRIQNYEHVLKFLLELNSLVLDEHLTRKIYTQVMDLCTLSTTGLNNGPLFLNIHNGGVYLP